MASSDVVQLKVSKADGTIYLLSWRRNGGDFAVLMRSVGEGLVLACKDMHTPPNVRTEPSNIIIRSGWELDAVVCEYLRRNKTQSVRLFEFEDSRCDTAARERRIKQEMVQEMAASCVNLAREIEPCITELLREVALKVGGELVGLDHRIKTRYSLERKLRAEIESVPIDQARERMAAKIKDALRYTICLKTHEYTAAAQEILRYLQGKAVSTPAGEGIIECDKIKNFWRMPLDAPAIAGGTSSLGDGMISVRLEGGKASVVPSTRGNIFTRQVILKGDEYQGINVVMAFARHDQEVLRWELQFHTQESLDVKEVSHQVYERFRLAFGSPGADPIELHLMYYEMGEMWDQVPRPDRVEMLGQGAAAAAAGPSPGESVRLPDIPDQHKVKFEAIREERTRTLKRASEILRDLCFDSSDEQVCSALMSFLRAKYLLPVRAPFAPLRGELLQRLLGKYQLRLRIVQELAAEPSLSLDAAAARVTDALRYTLLLPCDSAWCVTTRAWIRDMQLNGYVLTRLVNLWSVERGLSTDWRTPNGRAFQVQFHTPESNEVARLFERGASEAAQSSASRGLVPDGAAQLGMADFGQASL